MRRPRHMHVSGSHINFTPILIYTIQVYFLKENRTVLWNHMSHTEF
eukprot:SAG31_NODE_28768_length_405_cov_0.947712_1_plen_45_part_01